MLPTSRQPVTTTRSYTLYGLGLAALWATGACRERPTAAEPAPRPTHAARQSAPSSSPSHRTSKRRPPSPPGNTQLTSFNKAKRAALRHIYRDRRRTFYCDCRFDERKRIDYENCSYIPLREGKRSKRVEWEHIVPASAFGQSFQVWRDGHPSCVDRRGRRFRGRNCARKVSMLFRYMESDLHNLVPAIGELNSLRSNFSMAELQEGGNRFGKCAVKIIGRKFEPPSNIKGDVARAYLYMHQAYPGRGVVSRKNRKLYARWRRLDPVDTWECERDRAIAKQQGNHNPFVQKACQARGL